MPGFRTVLNGFSNEALQAIRTTYDVVGVELVLSRFAQRSYETVVWGSTRFGCCRYGVLPGFQVAVQRAPKVG